MISNNTFNNKQTLFAKGNKSKMQYRTFKETDEKITLFGLGTMRMPLQSDGELDENAAIQMIRRTIDKGVNYVDTAYMYHNFKAEKAVGKALQGGYREKVFLADKMPVWLVKTEDAMKELFYEQLENCQTDYFDFYLLHNVTKAIWKRSEKFNCLKFLQEMKDEGKIKHLGFSFHDDYDFFVEIVNSYNWDFCQIQLNFMDMNYQAGLSGLNYAASKKLPVIIMEPVKGGKLVDNLPPSIENYWKLAPTQRKPIDWALRWVANFDSVLTILCGVHSEDQMIENIEILNSSLPNSLTTEELSIVNKVSEEYNRLIKYSCTACNYCLPCPQKINIPTAIQLRNDVELYKNLPKTTADYKLWLGEGSRGADCTFCGKCLIKCPQQLPIPKIMKECSEVFGS